CQTRPAPFSGSTRPAILSGTSGATGPAPKNRTRRPQNRQDRSAPTTTASGPEVPMPLDPYVSCPCGSGKKFKWCCAPYYPQVEKAFEQEEQGQHEAALQTIKGLLTAHGTNPSVWLYYAQFLYKSGAAELEAAARSQTPRGAGP